jgi:hypothetical protein
MTVPIKKLVFSVTVASGCGFTHHTGCPAFRERVSADCGALNRQFDWLATNKKWAGPLLAHRTKLMLLPARVKPQSLVTVSQIGTNHIESLRLLDYCSFASLDPRISGAEQLVFTLWTDKNAAESSAPGNIKDFYTVLPGLEDFDFPSSELYLLPTAVPSWHKRLLFPPRK